MAERLRPAYLVVLVAALGAGVWAASLPGVAVGLGLLAVAATWCAGVAWLLDLIRSTLRHRRGQAAGLRWLLVAPALVLGTAGLVVADVPVEARFRLSRGAFDEVADRVEAGTAHDGGRVGLYRTEPAFAEGGGVFVPVDGGALATSGFARLPDGPTPDLEWNWNLRPLGDGWYAFAGQFD